MNSNIKTHLSKLSDNIQSTRELLISEIKKLRAEDNISVMLLFYFSMYQELQNVTDKIQNLITQVESLENKSEKEIKNYFLTFDMFDFIEG